MKLQLCKNREGRNMVKCIACFDIGGTFIKYAMIDEQGIVYEQGK